MSKRTFIIVIAVLILAIAAVAWFLVFGTGGTPKTVPINSTPGNNLFPFGQGPAGQNGQTGVRTGTSTATTTNIGGPIGNGGATTPQLPRLIQISHVPTAGAVALDMGSTTLVRYVERATGHIYQVDPANNGSDELSAVTIPKVHDAIWSADGKSLVLRYLRDDGVTIRAFAAQLSTSTSTDPAKALQGSFLPDNISDLTALGNKIFYLQPTTSGEQGIVANFDGTKKTEVLNSDFGDWSAVWTGTNGITIYPRPSATVDGAAYLLNPTTGGYPKLLGGIAGLAALSNSDGSYVVYSGSNQGSLGSAAYNVKKGAPVSLGFSTLADKCVWSKKHKAIVYCAVPSNIPNGTYPDDWYKGAVSFNDSIWMSDISTGQTTDIVDPILEANIPMDIQNMSLDSNETALLFTNKDDMTVWMYRLTE